MNRRRNRIETPLSTDQLAVRIAYWIRQGQAITALRLNRRIARLSPPAMLRLFLGMGVLAGGYLIDLLIQAIF